MTCHEPRTHCNMAWNLQHCYKGYHTLNTINMYEDKYSYVIKLFTINLQNYSSNMFGIWKIHDFVRISTYCADLSIDHSHKRQHDYSNSRNTSNCISSRNCYHQHRHANLQSSYRPWFTIFISFSKKNFPISRPLLQPIYLQDVLTITA